MDSPRDLSQEDSLLESLTLLAEETPRRLTSRELTGQPICKVRYTHQDMADFIIANPAASQNEMASRYGYSAGWVSQVINSDAFQVYLSSRRAEIQNPALMLTVEERMRSVTARSLDVLQEKLALPADMISDELALRAATLGAKALGMGNQAPAPAPPSVSLNDLAERLASLARRPSTQGAIDVQFTEARQAGIDPSGTAAANPG